VDSVKIVTLVSMLSLAIAAAWWSSGAIAESANYPGDLTKGKRLTIYIEGLADPSSGFFRVLNNGAQQAGRDLGVDVKYVSIPPASISPRTPRRSRRPSRPSLTAFSSLESAISTLWPRRRRTKASL
jgi:hypothetical protein